MADDEKDPDQDEPGRFWWVWPPRNWIVLIAVRRDFDKHPITGSNPS
jgi:hypothetical protein